MTETNQEPEIWFDLPALAVEHEANSSRVLKRDLVKQGYDKIMSLYGAVRDLESKELTGVRVEILARDRYTEWEVWLIHEYFRLRPRPVKYSIWIFEREHADLYVMGVYP